MDKAMIKEYFKLDINKVSHQIAIRGKSSDLPILLIQHGGPGSPCMSMFRKINKQLESSFIVVTWDQRGTGRSYSSQVTKESMTIEQLVSDTHQLTLYLKKRFNREKIFILGHSWGATLSLKVVSEYPEDYFAYFSVSQFINAELNEALSYKFTVDKATELNDKKSLKKLAAIGAPEDGFYKGGLKDTIVQKRIVTKYSGDFHKKSTAVKILLNMLFSREYGWFRFPHAVKGIKFSLTHLGLALKGINYFEQIPELKIPVYFFSGKYDQLTPQSILEEYFEKLKAPKKELFYFEESAHSPIWEEADKYHEIIKDIVKHY